MDSNYIIFIILLACLVLTVAVGLLVKRYKKKRLAELDGFIGIYKKRDCAGMPILIVGNEPLGGKRSLKRI